MKPNRFILIALSLFNFLVLFAAKPATIKGIPKECKVHKPTYSKNFINKEILSTFVAKDYELPEKTNQYWDVYSDRSNNVTYANSSTDTPYSELGFKEKVRIAKIQKGFALVYKADIDFSVFPNIPADAEWKGWIPMKNLVYLDKVLVNNEGVPISALINDKIDFDSRLRLNASLYYNPDDQAATVTLPNRSNSLFYVIKNEGISTLIATDTDISSGEHIYGWMSMDDLMIWNSRIAMEPTWDITDNEFFSQSGHSISIKGIDDEPIGSIDFIREQKGNKFTTEYHRLFLGAWRYPVIYNSSVSSLCAIPGQSSFLNTPSQRIPVLEELDNSDEFQLTLDSHDADINIVFVLDGSRLYEPFFPILAERISLMGSRNEASNINIGALIYHDSRSGDDMTELHKLTTPDDPSLYEFIDMGGRYGFKDNLSEAPLLAALDEVVNYAGFNPLAQNYVVLIGGRGDSSDSSIIPSEIAQKLASTNIGIYALQVQNNTRTAAYRLFGYLLEDILRQAVEHKYEASVSTICETGADYSSIFYYVDNNSGTEIFEGFRTINNGLMSEEDFESHIEEILQRINNSVVSSVNYSANLSSMYPQFFRAGLIDNNWEGRQQLKKVALFSAPEFDRLLSLFARLNDQYLQSSTDRILFYNTLTDYLPGFIKMEGDRSYYPYNNKNEAALESSIKKMGLYQLFSLIEGVNLRSVYKGRPMSEILSPKNVSDEEFLFILSDISRRYYRLLAIRNNQALYSSFINDQSFYWIPCDDLI